MNDHLDSITLAGGCFWCLEAVFKRLKGVIEVTSGYTGGEKIAPTYQEVCSGTTGHAEAVQIKFDPEVISLKKIFDVFWEIHDPTTLDQQGADIGTQYRSVIFYKDSSQKELAETSKRDLENSNKYTGPIVTEITKLTEFYPAEDNHKNYYDQNRSNGYCRIVIDPKIQKLMTKFSEDLNV